MDDYHRCPACNQVSHEDDWECIGADGDFQFCPACGKEVEPINLYLERLGAEQSGKVRELTAEDIYDIKRAEWYEARQRGVMLPMPKKPKEICER